jgi:hypothetical protein
MDNTRPRRRFVLAAEVEKGRPGKCRQGWTSFHRHLNYLPPGVDIFPPALSRLAAKGGQVGVAGLARAAGRMLRLAAEGG